MGLQTHEGLYEEENICIHSSGNNKMLLGARVVFILT